MATPATKRVMDAMHLMDEDLEEMQSSLNTLQINLAKDESVEGYMADSDWIPALECAKRLIRHVQEQLIGTVRAMETHK